MPRAKLGLRKGFHLAFFLCSVIALSAENRFFLGGSSVHDVRISTDVPEVVFSQEGEANFCFLGLKDGIKIPSNVLEFTLIYPTKVSPGWSFSYKSSGKLIESAFRFTKEIPLTSVSHSTPPPVELMFGFGSDTRSSGFGFLASIPVGVQNTFSEARGKLFFSFTSDFIYGDHFRYAASIQNPPATNNPRDRAFNQFTYVSTLSGQAFSCASAISSLSTRNIKAEEPAKNITFTYGSDNSNNGRFSFLDSIPDSPLVALVDSKKPRQFTFSGDLSSWRFSSNAEIAIPAIKPVESMRMTVEPAAAQTVAESGFSYGMTVDTRKFTFFGQTVESLEISPQIKETNPLKPSSTLSNTILSMPLPSNSMHSKKIELPVISLSSDKSKLNPGDNVRIRIDVSNMDSTCANGAFVVMRIPEQFSTWHTDTTSGVQFLGRILIWNLLPDSIHGGKASINVTVSVSTIKDR